MLPGVVVSLVMGCPSIRSVVPGIQGVCRRERLRKDKSGGISSFRFRAIAGNLGTSLVVWRTL